MAAFATNREGITRAAGVSRAVDLPTCKQSRTQRTVKLTATRVLRTLFKHFFLLIVYLYGNWRGGCSATEKGQQTVTGQSPSLATRDPSSCQRNRC